MDMGDRRVGGSEWPGSAVQNKSSPSDGWGQGLLLESRRDPRTQVIGGVLAGVQVGGVILGISSP